MAGTASPLVHTKDDLAALVGLAGEHFVGETRVDKWQYVTDGGRQSAGLDQRREVFQTPGRDLDEKEQRPDAVVGRPLLVGRRHGRNQHTGAELWP